MKNNLARGNSTYWLCCAVAVLFLCAAMTAAASQVSGAIYTTNATNTQVNANIYQDKGDVYLTGGPNNCKSGSGLTPGTYYFQVTAPPGGSVASEVLSEDAVTNRQFTVNASGYVTGYSGTHNVIVVNVCGNDPNTDPNNLQPGQSLGIQLFPYADTPNNGGVYKVWACENDLNDSGCIGANVAVGGKNDGSCGDGVLTSGPQDFAGGDSKTDNFKVHCTVPPTTVLWPISGIKFYDTNGNGVQDAGEPGIANWQIQLYASPATAAATSFPTSGVTMTTDALGNFSTDNNSDANKPVAGGVYGVCETIPTSASSGFAWQKTAACPKSLSYLNFAYGGLYTDLTAGHTDVAFSNGTDYSLQYPVTATGGAVVNFPHLGIAYANCGPGYYNNIDDVFERTSILGVPYGNKSTLDDPPQGTDLNPLFTDTGLAGGNDTWNHNFPGAVFGNRCVNTPGGGLTIGFWSNKNGNGLINTAGGLPFLNALSDGTTTLRFVGPSGTLTSPSVSGSGSPFDVKLSCSTSNTTTSTCFDTWLTNGSNSANSANQLSVQMTGAALNIALGTAATAPKSCGTGPCSPGPAITAGTYIYAPGTGCAAQANLGGYATLGCVIAEANYVLGQPGAANVPSSSTLKCTEFFVGTQVSCRTYETTLQTVLNNANNNVAGPVPGPAAGIALCGTNPNANACSVTPIDACPAGQHVGATGCVAN